MQMLRHWSSVRRYERPDAWVRRVAIRMAVKQAKRERMRWERERLAVVRGDPTPLPDPDLAASVAQLSPMQRAVVVLFYWEDQSVFDIARALEVSESTVKQHLFRAGRDWPACSVRRWLTMSVDDRLRAGLGANATAFQPAVESGLDEVRGRGRGRAARVAVAAGLVAAAAVAVLVVAWPDVSDRPPPATPPTSPTAALFGRYESDVTRPARLSGHWVLESRGTARSGSPRRTGIPVSCPARCSPPMPRGCAPTCSPRTCAPIWATASSPGPARERASPLPTAMSRATPGVSSSPRTPGSRFPSRECQPRGRAMAVTW